MFEEIQRNNVKSHTGGAYRAYYMTTALVRSGVQSGDLVGEANFSSNH